MSEETVFVRGTRCLKPSKIRDYFSSYGSVVSVKAPFKRDFVFVKFTTAETAEQVCQEKFHFIDGLDKKIRVSKMILSRVKPKKL